MWFEELRLGGGLTNVAQAQILPVKAHPRLRMVRATTGLEPAQSHGPQGALLGGMHYHLLCYLSPFGGDGGAAKMAAAPPCCSTVGGQSVLHDEERGSHVR